MRNQILLADCIERLPTWTDASIPMTLTSPPYDGLRAYGGHPWDWDIFRTIADHLWRLTMTGGIVCWVVRDEIGKSGQSGSSFRQALHFLHLGFRLHNTLIIDKPVTGGISPLRYGVAPEFVFVLSKDRPRTIHLLQDKENRHAGTTVRYSRRDRAGHLRKLSRWRVIRPFGIRGSVWNYPSGGGITPDRYAFGHPALMPEALARDLILSWSRPGDLILDPMAGAATTCKMALLNHRNYLGFEVHEPYHRLAVRRMTDAHAEYRRRLDALLLGA